MAFACWCALPFVLAGLGLGGNRTAFFKELKGGQREREMETYFLLFHMAGNATIDLNYSKIDSDSALRKKPFLMVRTV